MASTYYMLETPKTLETPQRHLFTSQEEFRGHQHLPCGEAVAGNKCDKVWLGSRMLAMFPSWG